MLKSQESFLSLLEPYMFVKQQWKMAVELLWNFSLNQSKSHPD